MLMPKKVKYRKQQRGRMCGKAWRGSDVSFGEFGLKALEPCWLTARQIEAARDTDVARELHDGDLDALAGDRIVEEVTPEDLETFVECSEAFLPLARGRSDLEILTEPRELSFDQHGMLPDTMATQHVV